MTCKSITIPGGDSGGGGGGGGGSDEPTNGGGNDPPDNGGRDNPSNGGNDQPNNGSSGGSTGSLRVELQSVQAFENQVVVSWFATNASDSQQDFGVKATVDIGVTGQVDGSDTIQESLRVNDSAFGSFEFSLNLNRDTDVKVCVREV